MRTFLSVTALLEGATGVSLILVPTYIVPLLLSSPLEGTAGIISARVAGIAIVFLALVCWFSINEKSNSGLLYSLFFYNFTIMAFLLYENLAYDLNSIYLWLVVVVHAAMGFWGIMLILKNKQVVKT